MIDNQEGMLLRSSKVFLVGRVLMQKYYNKDIFKKQMQFLWKPKVMDTIVELEQDLFSFGFDNVRDRTTVLQEEPWLFDRAFLVLAEADDLTHPSMILLSYQEFWVQIKGLPLQYMSR